MTARGTRLTGVRRIDDLERNAGLRCLVGNEAVQLREGPPAHASALGFREPCPRANPGQILDRDATFRVFCTLYKALRNHMVFMTPEPRLAVPTESQ